MSFLAILAPAWVPSEFNYRWSLPSDPLSDEGLGGGITWALDPSFCDTMLPSFHEDAPTTRYWGGEWEGEGPIWPTMVCSL